METLPEALNNYLDLNWPIEDHASELGNEDLMILSSPLVSIHFVRHASCRSKVYHLDHLSS